MACYCKKKTKPLPYDLFGGENNRKIKYRCRLCGADMSYYGRSEHHCHNCGGGVDWDVPSDCGEKFRAKYNILKAEYDGAALKKKIINLFYDEFKKDFTEEE